MALHHRNQVGVMGLLSDNVLVYDDTMPCFHGVGKRGQQAKEPARRGHLSRSTGGGDTESVIFAPRGYSPEFDSPRMRSSAIAFSAAG